MKPRFETRYRRLAGSHPTRQLALRHPAPSTVQHDQIGDRHTLLVASLDFGVFRVRPLSCDSGSDVIA